MSNNSNSAAQVMNILNLVDSFIEQMFKVRNLLRGVSISALILAPFAIVLSIYIINHQSFFNVMQTQGDFGVMLSVLLALVIGISIIWVITGIRLYNLIGYWNKKYRSFILRTQEIDNEIARGPISD